MPYKALAFVAGAACLLVVLWVALKPPPDGPSQTGTAVFELQLTATAIKGPAVLTVQQGDAVTIVFHSDRADELHLHGYNLQLDLVPDTPGRLEFIAEHAGRFELESHVTHRPVASLEVHPQ